MKSRPVVSAICAALFLAACGTSGKGNVAKPKLPEDWQRVLVGEVSFSLPPGVEETPVQSIEGVVRQFSNSELQVNVHQGDYASTLREFESASGTYEWVKIDGRAARGTSAFIDGKAVDGLYFPEPGEGIGHFSILVVSTTPGARQQAMLVLQSVEIE